MWPTWSSKENIINAGKRVGIGVTGVNFSGCRKVNSRVQKNFLKIANLLHPLQIVSLCFS